MAENQEIETLRTRVDALELTVAFQERALGKLDQVVLEFTEKVEQLQNALVRLRAEGNESQIGPQNDPPPHY
ncbi:MAG: SlyX family protein [Planctomycetota bacterium]